MNRRNLLGGAAVGALFATPVMATIIRGGTTGGTVGSSSWVLQAHAVSTASPTGGSAVLTIPSAANLLVVSVSYGVFAGSMTPSLTDTLGNSFLPAVTNNSGANAGCAIYFVSNPITGANTVTVSGSYASLEVQAWSGAAATSPLDQTGTGSSPANASSVQLGLSTPSQNNTLIITGFISASSFASINAGFTPGDSVAYSNGNNYSSGIQSLVQAVAAVVTPTITFASSSVSNIAMCGVSFKPAPTTSPNPVVSLTSPSQTSTTITLGWASGGGGSATSWSVKYRTPTGSGSYIAVPGGAFTATGGTVTGLASSTTNDFQVVATNSVGSSAPSTPLLNVSTLAPGANSLSVAAQPVNGVTSGVNGLTTTAQITLAWTGAAPSLPTALWSNGGGTPAVIQIAAAGNQITYSITTPALPNTYSLTLTGTGANTATAVATGIAISTAIGDFGPGIHGPTSVMMGVLVYGQIASYFVRGVLGTIVNWSLSDSGTGDAGAFTIGGGGLNPSFVPLPNSSYSLTIHASDAYGNAFTLPVTVQNPSGNSAALPGNVIFDSSVSPTLQVNVFANTVAALTSDPSGLFTYSTDSAGDPGEGRLTISQANVIANVGRVFTIQLTVSGGSPVNYFVFLAHESEPFQAWIPAATVYSSTPKTNGYGGINASGTNCDQLGTVLTTADSGIFTNFYTSNPTGLLNTYNYDSQLQWFVNRSGWTGLSGSPGVGTLNGTLQTTSNAGKSSTIILSLPVLAGTTVSPSAISIVPVSGLTNYSFPTVVAGGFPWPSGITLTDAYIVGTTLTWATSSGGSLTPGMILFGYNLFYNNTRVIIESVDSSHTATLNWSLNYAGPGQNATILAVMPKTVANVTVTGFTPNWKLTTIDVASDNCQIQNIIGGTRMPRYAIYGTGAQTAIVTAWEGSAIDETTPKIDAVTLTLTDGNGTYCRQSFNNTVSWYVYTGPALSVGPVGSGATWTSSRTMQTALWASPATYAGATIKVLSGIDNDWAYNPYGGSSYNGYWPCPLHFIGDNSQQASFTGTITGVSGTGVYATGSLAVSGVTGTVNLTDFIKIGGIKAGIIIRSGTGPYIVSGPGVVAMSSIAMTTEHQRPLIDFQGTAPADNSQGGLNCAGGWQIIWERLEVCNVTNGGYGNAGIIYITDEMPGDVAVRFCYIHNGDNGVFNGDYGRRIEITDSLLASCGTFVGNTHNIYISGCGKAVIKRNVSIDSNGHEFKCRAAFADITDNSFLEGCNWIGWDSPFQCCQGGVWTVARNVIMKGTNIGGFGGIGNANNGNAVEPYNESSSQNNNGVPGVPGVPMWADNNFIFDSNTIISTYGSGQPANGIAVLDWGPWGNIDPVRNTQLGFSITNTNFFNFASDRRITSQGVIPSSSGDTVLTSFPFAGTAFIDPLTGAQPLNMPLPSQHGVGRLAATPATSTTLGPYTTVMTVPSGSPSGTNVVGGLISSYDSNGNQVSGISGSVGGGQFSGTLTSTTMQLKTVGSLADGVYTPLVTISGVSEYFFVVVGAGSV